MKKLLNEWRKYITEGKCGNSWCESDKECVDGECVDKQPEPPEEEEELTKVLSEGISKEEAKQYGPPVGIISANPKLVAYIAKVAKDADHAAKLWAHVKTKERFKKDIKLCPGGHICPGSDWQPWTPQAPVTKSEERPKTEEDWNALLKTYIACSRNVNRGKKYVANMKPQGAAGYNKLVALIKKNYPKCRLP